MTAVHANERFRDLSEGRKRLLRRMQDIGFGRVTFHVVGGEPDLRRAWRTRRTVKLNGADNGERPEAASVDFELRKEHVALFEQMLHLRDGAYVTIEVKYGLPFIVEIEQEHEAA